MIVSVIRKKYLLCWQLALGKEGVLEKTFGNKMKNKSSVMVIKEGKWWLIRFGQREGKNIPREEVRQMIRQNAATQTLAF